MGIEGIPFITRFKTNGEEVQGARLVRVLKVFHL